MTDVDHQPFAARVAMHQGKPTLFVNDVPLYPMFYSLTDCPGGRWTWEEFPRWNLRNFAEQGVTLFQVDLWFEQLFSEEGVLDIELARRQIRGVLDVCPQAVVFIRLHVNASPAWTKAHPEECTEYANTDIDETELWGLHRPLDRDEVNSRRVSLASLLWRDTATERLRQFCQTLSMTPEGAFVGGIQIAGGVFGEWHYWAFIAHDPDTGPAMTHYFRQWLRDCYQTEQALCQAWRDPQVTFETVTVPTLEERKFLSDGIFRDPHTCRRVIDYYECQHEVVAEDIIHFCRMTKENWPRPIVTGTFYGYFFMGFGRHAAGGHLQIERMLASPYVDYLSAPMSYQGYCREIGGAGHARGVLGAGFQHGKLWLDEMDQASFMGGPYSQSFKTDLVDDIAIIRRNVAQSYTHGMGLWFYDFGPHAVSGWWDHPVLLQEIQREKILFDLYAKKPFQREADVLVVYDTNVFYHLGFTWHLDCVSHTAVDELTSDVYHSGVNFEDALLFDLEKVDWDRYHTVIFANTFLLSNQQRAFIREYVARNGRHIIWNYMPGYTNGEQLSEQFVSEVVGMQLEKVHYESRPEIAIAGGDFSPTSFRVWNPVPVFRISDPQATAYGHIKGTSDVAFASKQLADSTSWFCSLPLRDSSVLRAIFQRSGAHIYSQDGDAVFAGGNILCLHTARGGHRVVTLHNKTIVELELPPRSTTLLDSETGAILLQ